MYLLLHQAFPLMIIALFKPDISLHLCQVYRHSYNVSRQLVKIYANYEQTT
jgi:hypothetical protein